VSISASSVISSKLRSSSWS